MSKQAGDEVEKTPSEEPRTRGRRIRCWHQELWGAAAIHHPGVDLALQCEDQETETILTGFLWGMLISTNDIQNH